MIRFTVIVAGWLLALGLPMVSAAAEEPVSPTPIPAKTVLVFPGAPPTPAAPPVLPDAVSTLLPSQLFVVTSDQPFLLLASPARLVTITPESGPLRIRAVFADGSGKLETRTYAAKFIAIVEAASTGRVELIGVPNGFTDEADITRRLIDIGVAPQPPPGPDPGPGEPTVPPGPIGFRVLMVYDSTANLTREQLNILHSTQITAFLNTACTKGSDGRGEWRKWSPRVKIDPGESPPMVALWDSVKAKLGTLPRMVVATNGAATIMDLPATEAETLAKLKSLAGGTP